MARYVSVCLLFGTLAWGQAGNSNSGTMANAGVAPAHKSEETHPQAAVDLPLATPVITINGLCENPPANKSAAADCKTVITRAEFEKLVDTVQPKMPASARKQFASNYARALVMSEKAAQMGLDKSPEYAEHMRLARIQVLSTELNRAVQDEAAQISDKDIEDYYHNNISSFEQADMERIYIPKLPHQEASDTKLSVSEREKRTQASVEAMRMLADKLHARAVAGEDFTKLQLDAYEAAGIKSTAANVAIAKMMRSRLPASQVFVMDLKPGEISTVIDDQNGYFLYKLKSKSTLKLDDAREQIKGTLRAQHVAAEMKEIQESATTTFNDVYFVSPQPMPPISGEKPQQAADDDDD
jgi:hypothetical protein